MAENQLSGRETLMELLSAAVAAGADSVTLERESSGLEVMFNLGNTGTGYLIDRNLGNEMIDSLYEEKKKTRGRIRLKLHGKDYIVQVKTYDSFGETAYRLTFREAKR